MPAPSMTDHVARALHAAAPALALTDAPWEALTDEATGRYRLIAAKAIAAMRNPTDAMLAEGNRRDLPGDAANVWERMIFRAIYEDREAR